MVEKENDDMGAFSIVSWQGESMPQPAAHSCFLIKGERTSEAVSEPLGGREGSLGTLSRAPARQLIIILSVMDTLLVVRTAHKINSLARLGNIIHTHIYCTYS